MTSTTRRPTPLWQQVVAIGAYLLMTAIFANGFILLATGNIHMLGDMLWGLFQFAAWAIGLVTLVAGLYWLVFRMLPRVRQEGTAGEQRVPRKAHVVTRSVKPVPSSVHKGPPVTPPAPSVLLDLGGGRMKRSDMVTQADITDLIHRARKEEAVTWREQLLELDAQIRASVPLTVPIVTQPAYTPIGEGEIETWLEGITPDKVSYPFKAKRNLVALMKSYRAKQRSEGWQLVCTAPLPYSEDMPVPEIFDRSTGQHGSARLDTDPFSTGQHGKDDANQTLQNTAFPSGNTQKYNTETNPDSGPSGSETGNGETEGDCNTGTVGEVGGVQQLLAMGK